jgi:haloacetate dehalogenase
MILSDPDRFFESCLTGWGAARLSDFPAGPLAAYRAAWSDPATVAQMCHDYRAAHRANLADDTADAGSRIGCPALVLWGRDGVMGRLYDVAATWAPLCADLTAEAVPGGHFFIDTDPAGTASRLAAWLARQRPFSA